MENQSRWHWPRQNVWSKQKVCEACGDYFTQEYVTWAWRSHIAAAGYNEEGWYGPDGEYWPPGTYGYHYKAIGRTVPGVYLCPECAKHPEDWE